MGNSLNYLTERDIKVLHDLYTYRALTVKQIWKMYFESKAYAYRRLYMLKNENYVESQQNVMIGNEKCACYFITEQGIEILEERGLIMSRYRARDNKPDLHLLPHIIEVNELHVKLKNKGWQFIPSRDVKANRGINRTALLKGELLDLNGNSYYVYILENNSIDITIERIVSEIKQHAMENVMVLCKGSPSYAKFKQRINQVTVRETLNVLPYNAVFKILPQINSEERIIEMISEHGTVVPLHEHHTFAKYVLKHNGEEKLVANYLMGDHMMLYFLKKYTAEQYKNDGRKVIMFGWERQVDELIPQFQSYPHIEIVRFPIEQTVENETLQKA